MIAAVAGIVLLFVSAISAVAGIVLLLVVKSAAVAGIVLLLVVINAAVLGIVLLVVVIRAAVAGIVRLEVVTLLYPAVTISALTLPSVALLLACMRRFPVVPFVVILAVTSSPRRSPVANVAEADALMEGVRTVYEPEIIV
jgi:hypothetical protein